MDNIHEMIQQTRIDTRTPEATQATIDNILNIIQKLNEKLEQNLNRILSLNQIRRTNNG